jgi:ABC-2 type transport system permease protein
MTTTIENPSASSAGVDKRTGDPHLSFGGVLNSEWIKLRTLRSTFWCYVIIVALTVLLGLLIAGTIQAPTTTLSHDAQQSTWMSAATLGIAFSQLVVGVLGALMITGEYGTGMIRSTFAAVPKRLPAMFAKAIVFGVVTFLVSFVALVAAAFATAPLLVSKGVTADFGDPDVWLTLVGGAGYLALIGLIALAIGLLIRSSAGGIAAALGLLLVVPVVFSLVARLAQADWATNVAAFLPSNAGAKLYAYPTDAVAATVTQGPGAGAAAATSTSSTIDLTSWQGLLVLLGWFAVTFVVGLVVLKRRDA